MLGCGCAIGAQSQSPGQAPVPPWVQKPKWFLAPKGQYHTGPMADTILPLQGSRMLPPTLGACSVQGGPTPRERNLMASPAHQTVLSLMLAVPDTPAAVEWYKQALGAR